MERRGESSSEGEEEEIMVRQKGRIAKLISRGNADNERETD